MAFRRSGGRSPAIDFVVFRGFTINCDATEIAAGSFLESWLTATAERWNDTTIVHTGSATALGTRRYYFDGSAIGDRAYINRFTPIKPGDIEEILRAPEDVSGTYCLVKVCKNGRFSVDIDYMSQYFIWYYQDGDRIAVSNNIHFIERLLSLSGRAALRRVDQFAGAQAWGAAHRTGSGLAGVEILAPACKLAFNGRTFQVLDVVRKRSGSYSEEIDAAAFVIERNVLQVARHSRRSTSYDVTAGLDSRMVFAVLLKHGLHREFTYRCICRFPHVDGHYADIVAERYGLRPMVRRASDPVEVAILDVDEPYHIGFQSMGLGPRRGAGMQTVCHPDDIHLHGGFGEFGGASPDVKRCLGRHQAHTAAGLAGVYLKRVGARNLFGFMTPGAADIIRSKTVEIFAALRSKLDSPFQVPLEFYNSGKSRQHFGTISSSQGRTQQLPDVLHTRHLAAAAMHLTLREQAAGKVNFDVIRRLAGVEVLSLPLADKPWGPIADPEGIAGDDIITAESPPRCTRSNDRELEPRRAASRVSEDCATIPRELRPIFLLQRVLQREADAAEGVFDHYDRDAVAELAARDPAAVTEDERVPLTNIAAALIWGSGKDKPFSLRLADDVEENGGSPAPG